MARLSGSRRMPRESGTMRRRLSCAVRRGMSTDSRTGPAAVSRSQTPRVSKGMPRALGLADQLAGLQGVGDEALGHAAAEGGQAAGVLVQPLEQALVALEVGARGHQRHRARRGVVAQVAGQLQEGGDAAGALRGRRLRGHHRQAVIVGVDGDQLPGEIGVGAGHAAPDRPGRVRLEVHPRPQAHGDLAFAEALPQVQGRLPPQPEPGHVHGGPAPLGARLEVRRLLRLDEDDRAGAQGGRVLPVRPGVVLHEHDGALHDVPVEVVVLPGAAVEQVPAPALGPEGVGAHEVRPQRLERDRLRHAAVLVEQLHGGAVVHGHDDVVGIALHVEQRRRRAAPAPRSRRRSGRPGSRRCASRGRRAGGWCGRCGRRRRPRPRRPQEQSGRLPPLRATRRKPGPDPAPQGRPGPTAQRESPLP